MSDLDVTLVQISDEIYDRAALAWEGAFASVMGYGAPEGSFRARGVEGPLPTAGPWARAWVKPVDSERATVGTRDSSLHQKYENDGLLFVQVFVSSNSEEAPNPVRTATQLCEAIKSYFLNHMTPGGAYFMHERIEDDPEPEAKWFQVQFIAEWQFHNVPRRQP